MLHHTVHSRGADSGWVVLVHGAGGSAAVWYRQLADYRRRFNVLLVDLRGHGRSAGLGRPGDGAGYSFESIGRDVLEVLDHRGIERAHFVGISLGCLVIRTLAELAPERVRSMVLAGAITRLDFRTRGLIFMARVIKRVVPFLWLYRLYAWILLPRLAHRESRLVFVREARRLTRHEFQRWFRLTAELPELLARFEARPVDIPTLYVMGEQDHMFLGGTRALAAREPRALLRVIPGCGHVCTIQRAETFNRISLEFLAAPERAVGTRHDRARPA